VRVSLLRTVLFTYKLYRLYLYPQQASDFIYEAVKI